MKEARRAPASHTALHTPVSLVSRALSNARTHPSAAWYTGRLAGGHSRSAMLCTSQVSVDAIVWRRCAKNTGSELLMT